MKVIQTIFFIGLWIPVAQAKLRGVSDRGQDRFLAIRRTAMMATGGTSSGGAVATEVAIVGGVTTSSAVVGFRTDQSASVKIVYAANARFRGHTFSSSYTTLADDDFTGSILLNGLQPSQKYWYRITVDGVEQNPGSVQKFETFPAAGSTFRFSIFADAAPYYNNNAANAYSAGSSNPNEDDALFAMQIGDFDHSDPQDIAAVRLMHRGLRDINSAGGVDFADNILTKMSFVHVYDDHDVSRLLLPSRRFLISNLYHDSTVEMTPMARAPTRQTCSRPTMNTIQDIPVLIPRMEYTTALLPVMQRFSCWILATSALPMPPWITRPKLCWGLLRNNG